MRVSTRDLFAHCYGTYALPAVNVEFMEQILGVFAAAKAVEAPIIVQTTPMAREYAHPEMLVHMVAAAEAIFPEVVFALHLDHGVEAHIDSALESGAYTSVMIDASHDAFAQNVERTRKVVETAHALEIAVEAELGVLSGVEDDLDIDAHDARYTQPDEVEQFVKQTGCDALAIAIGTSHGAYKFSGGQGLQFDILQEIQRRLPGFPLVLHGASQVNPEEIQRINAAGGQLSPHARGVSAEELQGAIPLGICKVNLATDFRLLWTRVMREYFHRHPDQFAPIPPRKIYQNAVQALVMEKCTLLNATGQAASFLARFQPNPTSI